MQTHDGRSARDRDFARFVADHSGTLLRSAFVLTGSHARAEDVVQETFIKLYGAWDRVAESDGRLAYVRRIVYTTHISAWRSRLRERLFDQLPEVIVLRYYEGLSEAEIADVLGVTEGSVKTHASRALAKLRAWESASVGGAQ